MQLWRGHAHKNAHIVWLAPMQHAAHYPQSDVLQNIVISRMDYIVADQVSIPHGSQWYGR